jgi:hypothetical protein
VPQPDPNALPARSKDTAKVVESGSGHRTYYLEPGVYDGGLSFDGKTSVVMAPGVYYMRGNGQGGGFKFRGDEATSLSAQNVMLFNDRGTNTTADPDDTAYPGVSITGPATVTWTPPAVGTYQGMTLFQARGQDVTAHVAGQGGLNIKGVLYFPDALLDVAGGGENHVGNQIVSWRLQLRGSGSYSVTWNAGLLKPVPDFGLVE